MTSTRTLPSGTPLLLPTTSEHSAAYSRLNSPATISLAEPPGVLPNLAISRDTSSVPYYRTSPPACSFGVHAEICRNSPLFAYEAVSTMDAGSTHSQRSTLHPCGMGIPGAAPGRGPRVPAFGNMPLGTFMGA